MSVIWIQSRELDKIILTVNNDDNNDSIVMTATVR
jgi:hypothetical protein